MNAEAVAEATDLSQLDSLGSVTRIAYVTVLGFVVVLGLFMLMRAMVYREAPDFADTKERRIADIHLAERRIQQIVEEDLPDKPEEQEPPPVQVQPLINDSQVVNNRINISVDIKPGRINPGPMMAGGEYLPLIKISPIYPRRAQSRGIEGHCTVSYTVTALGTVSDPQVVDCSSPLFQSTSLKAALKFKYKPRVIDGQPIAVHDVQNRFIYELSD